MMKMRSLFTISMVFSVFVSGAFYNAAAISSGYILASTYAGSSTELFDKDGKIVFSWSHVDSVKHDTVKSGYSCYLLENGNLIRGCTPSNIKTAQNAAPPNGAFQEIDPTGRVVWADTIANMDEVTHHDFKPLPNGNILTAVFITTLKEDAVKAGVDTSVFSASTGMFGGGKLLSIFTEKLREIKPDRTGGGNNEIVWEWDVLDHITPTEQASTRPDRFAGYIAPPFSSQLMHLNGIDFNAKKNLILFSSRVFSEVFVIDRSTTTEQAAGCTGGTYGKGGDILYRWGHPSNYIIQYKDTMVVTIRGSKRDTTYQRVKVGHANDYINTLHCPTWIPEGYPGAGNIMMFHNNSNGAMAQLGNSQAVEINPWDAAGSFNKVTAGAPVAPLQPTWVYKPVDTMYSTSMSSALRLKNGNTIVHETYPGGNSAGNSSQVREVDPAGRLVGAKILLTTGKRRYDPMKRDTINVPYNAPKIMYYPEDYPGIVRLFNPNIAITQHAAKTVAKRVHMVKAAGYINFSNVEDAEIALYSLAGSKVASYRSRSADYRLSTALLPVGTYLLRVRTVARGTIERPVSIVR